MVLSVTRPTSGFPTFLSLEALSMQSPKAMDAGKANEVVAQGEVGVGEVRTGSSHARERVATGR